VETLLTSRSHLSYITELFDSISFFPPFQRAIQEASEEATLIRESFEETLGKMAFQAVEVEGRIEETRKYREMLRRFSTLEGLVQGLMGRERGSEP
jgi:hypothetical protein